MKVLAKSFSLVIILFPSISVISSFSKNSLLVKNGLIKAQKFLFVVMPLFLRCRGSILFFLLSETQELRCFFITVYNFSTAHLLLRRNIKIWHKGLVYKTSSVASNQTRWYKKRFLRKGYSVPRDFHGLKITYCNVFNGRIFVPFVF